MVIGWVRNPRDPALRDQVVVSGQPALGSANYYLVDNPIDRYSVGDRTPGIRHADDGSLTIVMQHDEPTDEIERANWPPTPRLSPPIGDEAVDALLVKYAVIE